MAKQGQHKRDHHDPRVSKGPNNPDKSVEITTGSYKKPETYERQQHEGKDPHKAGQHDKNEWNEDTRKFPNHQGATRAREIRGDREGGRLHSGRSGSDSNADSGTRGS
jgi:hypothetical protein